MPLYSGEAAAAWIVALMSSIEASLPRLQVRLPLRLGMTLPTALAAPVDAGMMFWPAPRPPRQSLPEGPSTVFCVAVVAWTVVMRPSTMPYSSLMILASGPRQLVVHEALERMLMSLV